VQDYPVYPPSLYRAISYVSTLGVPIYIMENGIPTAKDDPSRKRWIMGCLQQVQIGPQRPSMSLHMPRVHTCC
jgi:hypothetical protein